MKNESEVSFLEWEKAWGVPVFLVSSQDMLSMMIEDRKSSILMYMMS